MIRTSLNWFDLLFIRNLIDNFNNKTKVIYNHNSFVDVCKWNQNKSLSLLKSHIDFFLLLKIFIMPELLTLRILSTRIILKNTDLSLKQKIKRIDKAKWLEISVNYFLKISVNFGMLFSSITIRKSKIKRVIMLTSSLGSFSMSSISSSMFKLISLIRLSSIWIG